MARIWLDFNFCDFRANFGHFSLDCAKKERINQKAPVSDNPLAAQQARQFDPARSNVLGALVDNDPSRGQ